jgi:hypothetical protein
MHFRLNGQLYPRKSRLVKQAIKRAANAAVPAEIVLVLLKDLPQPFEGRT